MDSTVIAAIIGGAFTIFAPMVTLLITRYVDNYDKQIISYGRRAAISGKWTGTTSQYWNNISNFPVIATIKANRKIITGQFRIQYPNERDKPNNESEFKFRGGFLYDRFFQLNYISKEKNRIQFGSMILELSPSGEVLSGKYTGYGAFSKQIVSGDIELRRVGR